MDRESYILYQINEFRSKIHLVNDDSFEKYALELFNFQSKYNSVYGAYLGILGINPMDINSISEIPFLPIILLGILSYSTRSYH